MIDTKRFRALLFADFANAALPHQHGIVILERDSVDLELALASVSEPLSILLFFPVFGIPPSLTPTFVDFRFVNRPIGAVVFIPSSSILWVFRIPFYGPFAMRKHFLSGSDIMPVGARRTD